jgi:transcription antitermination factor NusG
MRRNDDATQGVLAGCDGGTGKASAGTRSAQCPNGRRASAGMARCRGLCICAGGCCGRARCASFRVYVPEVDETVIRRGRKIDRRVPMFSGYLFVFMWYSDQHWQWITNMPGVLGIVGSLSDAEVDIVRAIENRERPVIIELPAAGEVEPVARSKSKKKNRWKNRKSSKARVHKPKPITEQDLRNEIVATRAWSAFDDLIELDSEGRNQTLRKALGLS